MDVYFMTADPVEFKQKLEIVKKKQNNMFFRLQLYNQISAANQ